MRALPSARRPLRWRVLVTAAVAGALVVPSSSAVAAPPGAAGSGTLPLRGLDLDAVTIPELQQRMDSGELTAVELTQAYLDRIDDVDEDLGAVLAVNPDALDE